MPIIPTYPGVYIEEIPSGVRTITGVATSIAAFVGYFPQGLMDKAVQIFNMGDFEREFGGLNSQSEASYAIQQFFLNGGTEAWVVRTASGNVAASTVEILSGIDGATAITLEAGQNQFENPGTWGDNLRVNIDYPAPISGDSFNMTISLVDIVNGQEVVARSEVFNRLTMASVRDVVNDEFSGSKLMRVIDTGGSRPLQTGTVSGGPLAPFPTITNSEPELTVTIGTEGQGIARLSKVPTSLSDARSFLESAIRTARPELRAFAQATVSIVDNRLRILAGPTSANSQVTFSATTATDPTVNLLGLLSSTTLEGLVSGDLDGVFGGGAVSGSLQVNIGSSGPITLTLGAMNNLEEARNELETSIRDESGNTSVAVEDTDAFANARVVTYTDGSEEHLIVLPGVPDRAISFTQDGSDTTVGTLQLDNSAATPITAQLSEDITPVPTISSGSSVDITIGSNGPHTATTVAEVNTLGAIASQLETVFRSADSGNSPAFAGVRVATYSAGGQNRLVVIAGLSVDTVVFAPTVSDDTTVSLLGLSSSTTLEGVISGDLSGVFAGGAVSGSLQVNIGSSGPITLTLGAMNNLEEARNELETSIRDESGNTSVAVEDTDAFANARVVTYTDGSEEHLIVLPGVPDRAISFTQDGSDTTVGTLQLDNSAATPITAQLSEDITPVPTISSGSSVDITIGSNGPHTATTVAEVNTLGAIASQLETVFRSADSGNSPAFAGVRVATYSAGGQNRLVVLAGISGNPVVFAPTVLDNTTVNQLLLTGTGVEANVQSYAAGAAIAGTAQGAGNLGDDGIPPDGEALMGEQTAKTGINALLDVDLFNILCIPRTAMISEAPEALAVITAAQNFCEDRRAFFLLDTPTEIDEVQEIKDWLDNNSIPRSKNSALYFPRVSIPDPLNDFKLRSIGASGTIAGLYARIDSNRGVWKAPAGTEATLSNVFKLDKILTDPENGTLNKVAINCLRTFPIYGSICWGARTLEGVDEIGSEWKYVPVRRLALFIEETLFRGLKWVVFEPNDEPLWAQIRLNVGAFMQNLFRQGAFQGQTPRQAYLVKCDRETTTQNDIDRGIVNILVGFAPLKPAEFVFIQLQQLAGQIQI